MKTKRINKKLVLNKTTISHLGNGEMNNVQGGWTGNPYATCDYWCYISWQRTTGCESVCICQ
jgi:hypothetical protein